MKLKLRQRCPPQLPACVQVHFSKILNMLKLNYLIFNSVFYYQSFKFYLILGRTQLQVINVDCLKKNR